jgi:hypothetical protein
MTTDLAFDQCHLAGADLDGDDALDTTVLDHQIDAEMLVEALDRRILDRRLKERVQHVETGLVGGEPGALDLHAAEGAHIDVPVRGATPGATPVLELGQLFVAVGNEVFDHILLAQPVATTDGVVEMVLEAIGGQFHTCRAAFGGHGMATHRIDLRDQRDLEGRIRLRHSDRGPQAGSAAAHNHYICLVTLHASSFLTPAIARRDQQSEKPRRSKLLARDRLIIYASACRACLRADNLERQHLIHTTEETLIADADEGTVFRQPGSDFFTEQVVRKGLEPVEDRLPEVTQGIDFAERRVVDDGQRATRTHHPQRLGERFFAHRLRLLVQQEEQ